VARSAVSVYGEVTIFMRAHTDSLDFCHNLIALGFRDSTTWKYRADDGLVSVASINAHVWSAGYSPARKGTPQPFLIDLLRSKATYVTVGADEMTFYFDDTGDKLSGNFVSISLRDGAWIGSGRNESWSPIAP
jgi:hypothetical protein